MKLEEFLSLHKESKKNIFQHESLMIKAVSTGDHGLLEYFVEALHSMKKHEKRSTAQDNQQLSSEGMFAKALAYCAGKPWQEGHKKILALLSLEHIEATWQIKQYEELVRYQSEETIEMFIQQFPSLVIKNFPDMLKAALYHKKSHCLEDFFSFPWRSAHVCDTAFQYALEFRKDPIFIDFITAQNIHNPKIKEHVDTVLNLQLKKMRFAPEERKQEIKDFYNFQLITARRNFLDKSLSKGEQEPCVDKAVKKNSRKI